MDSALSPFVTNFLHPIALTSQRVALVDPARRAYLFFPPLPASLGRPVSGWLQIRHRRLLWNEAGTITQALRREKENLAQLQNTSNFKHLRLAGVSATTISANPPRFSFV